MTLTEASEVAARAFDGPVADTAYREGDLVGFFPAPVDMGDFELVSDGAGPVVVDLTSGEVTRFGSSILDWPEWLADGGTEVSLT